MFRNLFLKPRIVRLKCNVSKVKLQVAFGTIINHVTREGRKIMEDSSLLVGNGIPSSNTTWLTAPNPLMEFQLQPEKQIPSAV